MRPGGPQGCSRGILFASALGTIVLALARCLQHETDHLDGVLFIDRMDAERRKAAMRAIRHAGWLPEMKLSPHPMTHGYH